MTTHTNCNAPKHSMAHADLVSFRFVCLKFSLSSAAEPGLIWESGRSTFSDTDLQGSRVIHVYGRVFWRMVFISSCTNIIRGGAVYTVL